MAEEPEESDEAEDADLLVGYLEDAPAEQERHLLTRHFFPSKVGGRAAWLVPEDVPSRGERLQCKKCTSPLRLLLQVYASRGEEKESAFHRTVYVFVCTSCQPNEVRVFRAQLHRENRFYGPEPLDPQTLNEDAPQQYSKDSAIEAKCCWQCYLPPRGDKPENACAECQRMAKFSERPAMFPEHEISVGSADVPEGDADEDVGGEKGTDAKAEDEDDSEEEEVPQLPASASRTGDPEIDAKVQEYQDKIAKDPSAKLAKSEQKVFEDFCKERTVKDASFAAFQAFSSLNPGHMLRYEFGGKPMWFCEPNQFHDDPPRCPLCNGPRVFEFQIQPQLISHLSHSSLGKRLDYGTIVVYVCQQSCDAAETSSPYIEEYAYVQPEPTDEWQLPPV